jgi:MFS transporter, DHA2 family, multidrug resistance protein
VRSNLFRLSAFSRARQRRRHNGSAAFGVTATATIVAPVLGPTLGGVLTDTFNWRWVFLINIPVGVAAVFFASILVEDPPWLKRRSGHIDYVGLALITLGLGCFQVMLDRGENEDWFGSRFILLMAVLGGLAFSARSAGF